MELSPYLQGIAEDLDKVTALADDQTREIAGRLVAALEPSLRMALVRAISDAAAIVTADLDDVVAVVRMEGRDPVVSVERTGDAHPATPPTEDEGDDYVRVTVRLPEGLKQRAESRATQAEQSLNSWVVHAIRRASHEAGFVPPFMRPPTPGARRTAGWA
ncbi:MAG: toxin-antitoxin system HicB family antitoxin [Dermatophilaceae bacterium]